MACLYPTGSVAATGKSGELGNPSGAAFASVWCLCWGLAGIPAGAADHQCLYAASPVWLGFADSMVASG